jgi:putative thioredoxin
MAFHDGQPLDGFIGVQSEKNILDFIKKVASKNNSSSIDQDFSSAKLELEAGNYDQALTMFLEILKIEPNNISATALYCRCLLKTGQIESAREIIENLSGEAEKNQDYISVCSEIDLLKKTETSPKDENHESDLKAKISKNTKNHQARLDLAILYLSSGNNQSAIDELLRMVEIDPKWNDAAGRKQLVEIFSVLGNENELVIEGRKKLSSLLFN